MQFTVLPKVEYQVPATADLYKIQEKLKARDRLSHCCARLAWNVFSVVLPPIGIWRAIVFTGKKIAPGMILPAAEKFDLQKKIGRYKKAPTAQLKGEIDRIHFLDAERERFFAEKSNHARQVTLKTADDVVLDASIIQSPNQKNSPPDQQKWVVFFNGNGSCYEELLPNLKNIAHRTGANVLAGNYRGVMRSQGRATSSQHLALDGEALVQYLLSTGVQPQHILLHGWSLGGAVAAEVAANHQEVNREMHLCNERSFSTVKAVLKGWMNPIKGALLGRISYSAGWKFNSTDKYFKIHGKKLIIVCKWDKVIPYSASLYKALKQVQMSPVDWKLKNQRLRVKKLGIAPVTKAPYSQHYKPQPTSQILVKPLDQNGNPLNLSRKEIVEKYGHQAHIHFLSTAPQNPLNQIDKVYDDYVQFVRDALKIV